MRNYHSTLKVKALKNKYLNKILILAKKCLLKQRVCSQNLRFISNNKFYFFIFFPLHSTIKHAKALFSYAASQPEKDKEGHFGPSALLSGLNFTQILHVEFKCN